jgi:hypothetical protein
LRAARGLCEVKFSTEFSGGVGEINIDIPKVARTGLVHEHMASDGKIVPLLFRRHDAWMHDHVSAGDQAGNKINRPIPDHAALSLHRKI